MELWAWKSFTAGTQGKSIKCGYSGSGLTQESGRCVVCRIVACCVVTKNDAYDEMFIFILNRSRRLLMQLYHQFSSVSDSSIEVLSPLVLVEESPDFASSDEAMLAALDVEEVHRIFKLRSIDAARFIHDLNAVACDGRVSWISFLRYMCGLANARPLTEESRAAVAMAKKLFDVYDEGKQREVDLRALASGLAVRTIAIHVLGA